ncbi:MAG TPA: glycosyltransferase [Arcobacter sp.]|nr:glycosyltransferase [Arcobacter sp.]
MNNQILVSVIIPSYNHEQYIEKAVLSVVYQTYKHIELIVIDDGSQDASHDILSNLSQQHNFQYIHRQNRGLLKTLNEALSLTSGQYFTMLGSDDYFYEDKIEKQISFFKSNPAYALCYGNVTFIDYHNNILKNGKTKYFQSGYIFNKLLHRNFIPLPTVMLKTEIIKKVNGFDERFFLEDYPLWLKISKKYQIGYIKDCLTYYRLHDSNVSGNIIKMIKETEKILKDWENEPEYQKSINKLYLRWFADLSKTDALSQTKEYMQKSFTSSFYKPRFIKSAIRYFLKQNN